MRVSVFCRHGVVPVAERSVPREVDRLAPRWSHHGCAVKKARILVDRDQERTARRQEAARSPGREVGCCAYVLVHDSSGKVALATMLDLVADSAQAFERLGQTRVGR